METGPLNQNNDTEGPAVICKLVVDQAYRGHCMHTLCIEPSAIRQQHVTVEGLAGAAVVLRLETLTLTGTSW